MSSTESPTETETIIQSRSGRFSDIFGRFVPGSMLTSKKFNGLGLDLDALSRVYLADPVLYSMEDGHAFLHIVPGINPCFSNLEAKAAQMRTSGFYYPATSEIEEIKGMYKSSGGVRVPLDDLPNEPDKWHANISFLVMDSDGKISDLNESQYAVAKLLFGDQLEECSRYPEKNYIRAEVLNPAFFRDIRKKTGTKNVVCLPYIFYEIHGPDTTYFRSIGLSKCTTRRDDFQMPNEIMRPEFEECRIYGKPHPTQPELKEALAVVNSCLKANPAEVYEALLTEGVKGIEPNSLPLKDMHKH